MKFVHGMDLAVEFIGLFDRDCDDLTVRSELCLVEIAAPREISGACQAIACSCCVVLVCHAVVSAAKAPENTECWFAGVWISHICRAASPVLGARTKHATGLAPQDFRTMPLHMHGRRS